MLLYILLGCVACFGYFVFSMIKKYDQIRLADSDIGKKNNQTPLNTVVIMGGGIGGLIAAKMLSSHAKKVIVLERSKRPEGDQSIVKHGFQTHNILHRGMTIVERLFPGITEDCKAKGGLILPFECNMQWWSTGGWRLPIKEEDCHFPAHLYTTREILETCLRSRIDKLENVEVRYSSEVTNLITNPNDKLHIIGVNYLDKVNNVASDLNADLVVDCSGMTSQTGQWFNKLGVQLRKSKVISNMHYATQRVKCSMKNPPGTIYYQQTPPENWYGAICWRVSAEDFYITLIAINKNEERKVPTDPEEIKKFLTKFPLISDVYAKSTPITPMEPFAKEGNQYIFYEEHDLHGYVAIGDSVCSFNPVYGQGVTMTAEGSLLLDNFLRTEPFARGFCKKFQSKLSDKLTFPWILSVVSDLRFPNTYTDNSTLKMVTPIMDKFMVRWLTACTRNKVALDAFFKVLMNEEGYIWAMNSPYVLYHVLTG